MRVGPRKYGVDALRVELRRPPHDAMDLVPFFKQEFCEVRSVLPGNAGDQCFLSHF